MIGAKVGVSQYGVNQPTPLKYQRVLLKLSGEALMGDDAFGISRQTIERIALEIRVVYELGVELAVVIGGGNIFRGVAGRQRPGHLVRPSPPAGFFPEAAWRYDPPTPCASPRWPNESCLPPPS